MPRVTPASKQASKLLSQEEPIPQHPCLSIRIYQLKLSLFPFLSQFSFSFLFFPPSPFPLPIPTFFPPVLKWGLQSNVAAVVLNFFFFAEHVTEIPTYSGWDADDGGDRGREG